MRHDSKPVGRSLVIRHGFRWWVGPALRVVALSTPAGDWLGEGRYLAAEAEGRNPLEGSLAVRGLALSWLVGTVAQKWVERLSLRL